MVGENKFDAGGEDGKRERLAGGDFMVAPDAGEQDEINERGEGGDGIDGPGVAGEGDDTSAGRAADHPGKLKRAAVEGDGARELFAGDQMRQKGGVGGPKDGFGGAKNNEAKIHARNRSIKGRDERQAERRQADEQVHEQDDALAVKVVRDVAGGESP